MLCLEKVAGILKEESVPSVEDDDGDELVKRRRGLAERYDALPAYGSVAYWKAVEA